MNRIWLLLVLSILTTACAADVGRSAGGASSLSPTSPDQRHGVEIYAAVIKRLVTKDHTFGTSATPFDHVYVVDGVVVDAGNPRKGLRPARQPFSEEMKRALRQKLGGLPPLDFIDQPDSVRLGEEGMDGVKNNGVIISLGRIAEHGEEMHVSTGLWCGGTCGQWLTYVLSGRGSEWKVTGTTGTYAIA